VREGWLLGERPARDQQGEYKYYWSNLPATTPLEKLVEYSHRRHAIEQFHEEAKGELGWDQYQGRRWRGFHRHAATVMLAYSFLVWDGSSFQGYIGRWPVGYDTRQCCGG
jgi:SRSO17 transposase